MGFTVKERKSYRWTVEHVVGQRGGKPDVMSFDAEFRALTQAAVQELMKRVRAGEVKDPEFLDQILVGWHGLSDARGQNEAEFTFDKTNLDTLLELYPGITGSITRAFMDSTGQLIVRYQGQP